MSTHLVVVVIQCLVSLLSACLHEDNINYIANRMFVNLLDIGGAVVPCFFGVSLGAVVPCFFGVSLSSSGAGSVGVPN